jgi:flagellar hook-length control protein FliK
MMQQVATSKADIAAFAANTTQHEQQDSSRADDFGALLQQQQQDRDTVSSIRNAKQEARESAKEAAQQTPRTNDKNDEDLQTQSKSNDRSTESTAAESRETDTELTNSSTSDKQVKTEENKKTVLEKESISHNVQADDQRKIVNSGDELQLAGQTEEHQLAGQKADSEDQVQGKNDSIVENEAKAKALAEKVLSDFDADKKSSEQWVSLVDNLKELNSQASESSDVLPKDVSGSDTVSINATIPVAGIESVVTGDETSAKPEANKSSEQSTVAATIDKLFLDSGLHATADDKAVILKSLDSLLEQGDTLQIAFEKLQAMNLDESVAKTDVTNKNPLKSLEKLDSVPLLDESENKALLAALLIPEQEEGEIASELDSLKSTQVELNIPTTSSTQSSAQTVKKTNTESVLNLENPNSTAVQQTLEHETQVEALQGLANVSADKLDKVLVNLAQRVLPEGTPDKVNRDVLPKLSALADITTQIDKLTTEPAHSDFIAALKTGIAEFKAQVAQGREPGIDLKSLVAEAMSKVSENSKAELKPVENLDAAIKSFSQVLQFGQQIGATVEQYQQSSSGTLSREIAQTQVEQTKQLQGQNTQLDKALNLSKPEGHVQLAEKVRWMVNAKQLVADIRLDPAELGSMQVKVAVNGDSASVSFVVQSHHARDAVENAAPKLRELLADKGIELGQSSVRQDDGEQGNNEQGELADGKNGRFTKDDDLDSELLNDNVIQQPIVNGALGGIDYFV